MYMHMCICVRTYIYIYIYMYVYIYIYVYTHAHTSTSTCTHAYAYTYAPSYTHTYSVCWFANKRATACTPLHANIYMCTSVAALLTLWIGRAVCSVLAPVFFLNLIALWREWYNSEELVWLGKGGKLENVSHKTPRVMIGVLLWLHQSCKPRMLLAWILESEQRRLETCFALMLDDFQLFGSKCVHSRVGTLCRPSRHAGAVPRCSDINVHDVSLSLSIYIYIYVCI